MGFFRASFLGWLELCALLLLVYGHPSTHRTQSPSSSSEVVGPSYEQSPNRADAICSNLASFIFDEKKGKTLTSKMLTLMHDSTQGTQENSDGLDQSAIHCYLERSGRGTRRHLSEAVRELPCASNCTERAYIYQDEKDPSAIHVVAYTGISRNIRHDTVSPGRQSMTAVVIIHVIAKGRIGAIFRAGQKLSGCWFFRYRCIRPPVTKVEKVGPQKYRITVKLNVLCVFRTKLPFSTT